MYKSESGKCFKYWIQTQFKSFQIYLVCLFFTVVKGSFICSWKKDDTVVPIYSSSIQKSTEKPFAWKLAGTKQMTFWGNEWNDEPPGRGFPVGERAKLTFWGRVPHPGKPQSHVGVTHKGQWTQTEEKEVGAGRGEFRAWEKRKEPASGKRKWWGALEATEIKENGNEDKVPRSDHLTVINWQMTAVGIGWKPGWEGGGSEGPEGGEAVCPQRVAGLVRWWSTARAAGLRVNLNVVF